LSEREDIMTDQQTTTVETVIDKDVEIINNLEGAPSIYIDGIQGFAMVNDCAKLNLYQILQNLDSGGRPSATKKVIVARLVMSPGTLLSVAAWLAQRAKDIQDAIAMAAEASSDANK